MRRIELDPIFFDKKIVFIPSKEIATKLQYLEFSGLSLFAVIDETEKNDSEKPHTPTV